MNYIKKILTIISCLFYILSGWVLFYQYISLGGFGIELLFLPHIFLVSSLIGFLMPIDYSSRKISAYFKGVVIWLILLFLICFIALSYDYANNRSKNIFIAEFSWEAGIELFLRENGTYKAINNDWMSSDLHYGQYKIDGNNIIIEDNLRLGDSKFQKTLVYDSLGLHFWLEKTWDNIEEGSMQINLNELFEELDE